MTKMHMAPPVKKPPAKTDWSGLGAFVVVVSFAVFLAFLY
jgi:hypothetical protein